MGKFLTGIRLDGPSGPLGAQLGGSVLLPCSVETPLPLEELEVEWRRTDSDVLVHLFQEGEERPESQDYAYRGRGHFSPDKIAQGDYSLLLENITSSDMGLYRCVVYTDLDSSEISCEIKNVDFLVVHGVHHAGFVYAGEEVVLHCFVDSHIPPEKLEEVSWKRTDNEMLVLLYQHGEVLSDSSHERYKGRAEFFLSEIPKGNFSLRLKDVRTEDKGEFTCVAHSGNILGNTTVVVPSLGEYY
ncbi:butyrophilin-like protein 1 [Alosa alosa]|uniref:butyrophilin-like protein 1 n=1 Tax=Alosa alosa TaxID=278164 RepID=UPI0020154563|nr:butyrophilin-like protein 1 [Alosa alosa]